MRVCAAAPLAPCRAPCARPPARRAALPVRAMAADGAAPAQKLWCAHARFLASARRRRRHLPHARAPRRGGRFSEKIDPLMEKFNESLSFDKRMAQEARTNTDADTHTRMHTCSCVRASTAPAQRCTTHARR
jgi:hypothetical protein